MLKNILQDIVNNKRQQGVPDFVIKNFIKEYLQYPTLEFIYSQKEYQNFIFTGGSCLRMCFGLPRLSEDLDFDLSATNFKKLDLPKMAKRLEKYFSQKFMVDVITKCQGKTRIYLKFPILKDLGLATTGESQLLYVKIEPNQTIFKNHKIELTPISNYGFNTLVRNYTQQFLMTGKLNAIFTREWFKGKDNDVDVKGRDFYDLFWYLEKQIEPDFKNLKRLTNIDNWTQLKKLLKEKINKKVTTQKLSYDLKNFFSDQNFVIDFCKNYTQIINKFL